MSEPILEQVRRFLDWTSKKISLHFASREDVYFDEREIWWASLGENVGSETNGKNFRFERPIVVLRKFSKNMLLAVPCTTKPKSGTWYHRFLLDGQERRAVMAQMRTISSQRLIRKLGTMSHEDFVSLRDAVIALIKTNPPT